jgi:hypothetical protein
MLSPFADNDVKMAVILKYNKPLRCSEIASPGFNIKIFPGRAGTGAGVVACNLHNLIANWRGSPLATFRALPLTKLGVYCFTLVRVFVLCACVRPINYRENRWGYFTEI